MRTCFKLLLLLIPVLVHAQQCTLLLRQGPIARAKEQ